MANTSKGLLVVADDNQDGREMLAALLRLEGYEVHTAPDGVAAFELVRKLNPKAVISDIQMPGGDGISLAINIRNACGKTMRLIALTGLVPRHIWQQAMDAGFDYYLLKPVTGADLVPYIEDPLPPADL